MTKIGSSLHVLHLTAGSIVGGVSQYILDLSEAMIARGHRVTVAGEAGAWHKRFEAARVPWIDVPMTGGPGALIRCYLALRQFAVEQRVDIVHSHNRRASIVGRRIAGVAQAPLLYSLHLPNISLNWLRRMGTDFGDITHAPSEEASRWLIEQGRVNPENVRLIPHGIRFDRYPLATEDDRRAARARFGIRHNAVVLGFVGRFEYPKNAKWMLDIAAAGRAVSPDADIASCSNASTPVAAVTASTAVTTEPADQRAAPSDGRDGSELVVLMAGEGPDEPALRRQIANQNLGRLVHLAAPADAAAVYHACDAILLPSLREAFSYVTAEAMCSGRPVLRTRTGGSAALILENITGRTTAIDHDAFIAAALDFARDRTLLAEMGRRAAEHVRANFSFDRQVDATIDLYQSMRGTGR
jgi:glycosyltransferase involved in cell wall biosynthesis